MKYILMIKICEDIVFYLALITDFTSLLILNVGLGQTFLTPFTDSIVQHLPY